MILSLLEIHTFWILITGGFFIGILSVVIGGGMFFSVPLIQLVFPEVSLGSIAGNIKTGSFLRGTGTIASTYKRINFRSGIKTSVLAFLGTVIGASLISDLSQIWTFPVTLLAVVFALYAPKLSRYITSGTYGVMTFVTGFYAGIFGAGIGIILVALLRIKKPLDNEIADVKIQARFIEWLLVIVAVITHYLHGNLVTAIWLPWSIGNLAGGFTGGVLLHKMRGLAPDVQRLILYSAFGFAVFVSGVKALETAIQ